MSSSPLEGGGVPALAPTLKSLKDLENAANNMLKSKIQDLMLHIVFIVNK